MKFVIMIDALDECERDEDVRAILRLLERTKDIKPVSLRVFVTSRPELPLRLGFRQMSDRERIGTGFFMRYQETRSNKISHCLLNIN